MLHDNSVDVRSYYDLISDFLARVQVPEGQRPHRYPQHLGQCLGYRCVINIQHMKNISVLPRT